MNIKILALVSLGICMLLLYLNITSEPLDEFSQISIQRFESKEEKIIIDNEVSGNNLKIQNENKKSTILSQIFDKDKRFEDRANSWSDDMEKFASKYHTGMHYDKDCVKDLFSKRGEVALQIDQVCHTAGHIGLLSARLYAICGEFAYSFSDLSKKDLNKEYTSKKGDTTEYWYLKAKPDIRCGYAPDYGESGPPGYPQ